MTTADNFSDVLTKTEQTKHNKPSSQSIPICSSLFIYSEQLAAAPQLGRLKVGRFRRPAVSKNILKKKRISELKTLHY